ncbi:hypothetical protein GALL_508120 [mine drainage metagenome]|uniref:Uncharacterized protein n=1 Tax=mine drainage metagenome TaxID=410659 RepID=A0A1J5PIJ6_9ZZZZ
MGSNNSSAPLDALTAFAIAFIAGAMAAASLIKYIEHIRHDTIVLRRRD